MVGYVEISSLPFSILNISESKNVRKEKAEALRENFIEPSLLENN